jgi:hypothetical protein
MKTSLFFSEIYKKYNLDLQHLNEEELIKHFSANQGEQRIYGPTETSAEFLSMRWLRGKGIEFGAGDKPIPLFGNAEVEFGDIDSTYHTYGGGDVEVITSVDNPELSTMLCKRYDFVIASHVLEHCDSFIRAIENLCSIVVPGGIVYLVLPDIAYIHDHKWMPSHDFSHHLEEYDNPMGYATHHMKDYANGILNNIDDLKQHMTLTEEYVESIQARNIPTKYHFIHHKHTYTYSGWLTLLLNVRHLFQDRININIIDSRYDHERKDCHFVIKAH